MQPYRLEQYSFERWLAEGGASEQGYFSTPSLNFGVMKSRSIVGKLPELLDGDPALKAVTSMPVRLVLGQPDRQTFFVPDYRIETASGDQVFIHIDETRMGPVPRRLQEACDCFEREGLPLMLLPKDGGLEVEVVPGMSVLDWGLLNCRGGALLGKIAEMTAETTLAPAV